MRSIIDDHQSDGYTVYAVENQKRFIPYQCHDNNRKLVLISGVGEINYGNSVYKIDGSVLLVDNAGLGCTWIINNAHRISYVCSFTEDFHASCLDLKKECDAYFASNPVFNLNLDQEMFVRTIFDRMTEEKKTDYAFKSELMQDQLSVLFHLAFRMVPSTKSFPLPRSPFHAPTADVVS